MLGVDSEQMRPQWEIQADMTGWYLYWCHSPSCSLCYMICRLDTMHVMSNIALMGSASSFRLSDHSSPSHTLFLFSLLLFHHRALERGIKNHLALPINFRDGAPTCGFSPLPSSFFSLFLSFPATPLPRSPNCMCSWWAYDKGEVSGWCCSSCWLAVCSVPSGRMEVFTISPSVFLLLKRQNWVVLKYSRPNIKSL